MGADDVAGIKKLFLHFDHLGSKTADCGQPAVLCFLLALDVHRDLAALCGGSGFDDGADGAGDPSLTTDDLTHIFRSNLQLKN